MYRSGTFIKRPGDGMPEAGSYLGGEYYRNVIQDADAHPYRRALAHLRLGGVALEYQYHEAKRRCGYAEHQLATVYDGKLQPENLNAQAACALAAEARGNGLLFWQAYAEAERTVYELCVSAFGPEEDWTDE